MKYTEKIIGKHKIYVKENIVINKYYRLHAGVEYDIIEFVVDGSGQHGFRFLLNNSILFQCNKDNFINDNSSNIKFL